MAPSVQVLSLAEGLSGLARAVGFTVGSKASRCTREARVKVRSVRGDPGRGGLEGRVLFAALGIDITPIFLLYLSAARDLIVILLKLDSGRICPGLIVPVARETGEKYRAQGIVPHHWNSMVNSLIILL